MESTVLQKVLRFSAGLGLLLLGIVMLFTPGPGLLSMAAGLYLMVTVFPGGKAWSNRLQERYFEWREKRG